MLTRRADFDQQSLRKWQEICSRADPNRFGFPTYIFRWEDTGAAHSQYWMSKSSDESWYGEIERNCILNDCHDLLGYGPNLTGSRGIAPTFGAS